MRAHRMRAAVGAAGSGLVFVGGAAFVNASSSTPSCSLTGLTGGLSSSPASGDLVVACIALKDSDRNIQCTTSGYTEVADLFSTGSNESALAVYYKALSSAETSVAFNLGATKVSVFAVHVWRNVNATQPDAATTTATMLGRPNAPSITTSTDGAVVLAVGAQGDGGSGMDALTVPSGMEKFFGALSTNQAGIGIASITRASAGAYDPPTFGGGTSSTNNASCAATLAIRPG